MGLSDFDEQIYRDQDLLDWAKQAPRSPSDYDHRPSEEEQAAYDYDVKQWRQKRPDSGSGYADR